MPIPSARSTLTDDEPWPGPVSYTEGDANFFCGRGEETMELRALVLRNSLSLLYGISGLGKTSLLQAGLFPQLRSANYFPVYVRLKHEDEDNPQSLSGQVLQTLREQAERHEIDAPKQNPGESLWRYFHRDRFALWNSRQRLVTPVLIFDQFEEIFTRGRVTPRRMERLKMFLNDFSALIEGRIPSEGLESSGKEGEPGDFFVSARLHALISIREDFLPHLFSLRESFPSLRRNEMRLVAMTSDKAREVILKPGKRLIASGADDAVLDFFASDRGDDLRKQQIFLSQSAERHVDPALLSLLLHGLNRTRIDRKIEFITPELARNEAGNVLSSFYTNAFGGLAESVRRFVEEELISPGGFRESRSLDHAVSKGVSEAEIDHLVAQRILRYEESAGGPRRIELAHDVLCGVIRRSQSAAKAQELEEQRKIEQQAIDEQRRATGILSEQLGAKRIRIYLSSPGDVGIERACVERTIAQLQTVYSGRAFIELPRWEFEPLQAQSTYAEVVSHTGDFDLVIFVFWSRLGTPLASSYHRPDGTMYMSAAEYEFESALDSCKRQGRPKLLVYRRSEKISLFGEGGEQRVQQFLALEEFFKKWFSRQDAVFAVAFREYRDTPEFEQLIEADLKKFISDQLPSDTIASSTWKSWTEGSPYRGLQSFEFEHAPIFFGRTRAVEEVLSQLRARDTAGAPFLLIFGASGVGKSSLLRAGILPTIVGAGAIKGVELWRRTVFRPGINPFLALSTALLEPSALPDISSTGFTAHRLADLFREEPEKVTAMIREALLRAKESVGPPDAKARLVVGIDQLEELFVRTDMFSLEDQSRFFRAIKVLVRSRCAWVIATMRSDFFPKVAEHPQLAELAARDGQYVLLPPTAADIGQMIRLPAQAAGLRFEMSPDLGALDEVLADQVKNEPQLLPLLEFALDELYQQRTADGLITFEAYRVHLDGGIVRALAKRADNILESLPELSRDAFRSVMRRLATTVDDTAAGLVEIPQSHVIERGASGLAFQRQRVVYDELTAYPPGAKDLVDAFIAARLLVVESSSRAGDQAAEVTVAHEALFEHWAVLKDLLLAEWNDLILPRARVAASHKRWQAENRTKDFLLPPGKQLSEAEHLLAEYGEELTSGLKHYISASIAQARAQQRRRQRLLVTANLVLAGLALGASAAAIFGIMQKLSAEREAAAALAAQRRTVEVASQGAVARARYSQEVGSDSQALAFLAQALRLNSRNYEASVLTGAMLAHTTWPIPLNRFRQDSGIKTAQFSPDGQRIVTGSLNGAAVWDGATGKLLRISGGAVSTAQFSPDGHRIVTASVSGATVWDAATGKLLLFIDVGGAVSTAQFSPDGQTIVTGSLNGAAVWDAATGRLLSRINRSAVTTAQFSPDGQRVLTGSVYGMVQVWDVVTSKPLGEPINQRGAILSAQFSPDGQRLVTAAEDGTAQVWDALTGKPLGQGIKQKVNVISAQFSPDGQRLVTVSMDKTAQLWDAVTSKRIGEPMRQAGPLWSAEFSPDGQLIVTASSDGTVQIWDAVAAESISLSIPQDGTTNSAEFSPDGQLIVTASSDGTARLWNAGTADPVGEPIKTTGEILNAQFSPDGLIIATTCSDGTARVWDTATSKAIGEPMKQVLSLQFSPDGKRIVTVSSDGTATVWDATDGRILLSVKSGSPINIAQFSPDGLRIVTASPDGKVQLWDLLTGKPIGEPMWQGASILSAQFNPDGQQIVTASSDGAARLWDAATGKPIGEPMWQGGQALSARFSPDGRRIVTASSDGAARLWDAATAKPIGEPIWQGGQALSARFSPDGQRVVTASRNGTARLWDFPTITSRDTRDDVERLADLAEATGGFSVASSSQAEILNRILPDQIRTIREKIATRFQTPSSKLTPLQRLMKWSVADPRTRSISPLADVTIPEWIEQQIRKGSLENLRAAMRVDPTNARVAAHFGLRLAEYALKAGTDPDLARQAKAEADFQTRRALRLAPNIEEVRNLRAEVVKLLGLSVG